MNSLEIEEDAILYKMHSEASKRGRNVLSLRPYKVEDFSSQYGSNDSISYTAENILGTPTIFPKTGDNAYSYQLRTYGEWWSILPSSFKCHTNLPSNVYVESQDFIEFRVEKQILPKLIRIYEVYSPGSIVKLFAFSYTTKKWIVLWQGPPQHFPENQSNCFTVEFKGVTFLSDFYRIEFYHKHLSYFCEIDGLILYGEDFFPQCFPSLIPVSETHKTYTSYLRSFFQSISPKESSAESACVKTDHKKAYFDALPGEIIHIIISHLDLQSLCIVSQVSKLFQKFCYDPVLYRNLNLQLYWHLVDSNTLQSLQSRLSSLKELNMSWCGGQNRIKTSYFIEFLEACCQNVTSLKLSNCCFVNNNCLKAIESYCPSLKELVLQSCRAIDLTQIGFKYISQMTNITYLDLYRTLVDKSSIIAIIKSLKLEHLILGNCSKIYEINDVVHAIAKHLKLTLKTLDLYRASDLNCVGVYELGQHCSNLVELDLGWCYLIDARCGCVKQLISNCSKLKKLFLTSITTVSSSDLNALACHCPELEQLDILSANRVNVASVQNLLQNCKHLMLLDLSYCDPSLKAVISELETSYTHVKFKYSAPTPNLLSF